MLWGQNKLKKLSLGSLKTYWWVQPNLIPCFLCRKKCSVPVPRTAQEHVRKSDEQRSDGGRGQAQELGLGGRPHPQARKSVSQLHNSLKIASCSLFMAFQHLGQGSTLHLLVPKLTIVAPFSR